MREFDDCLEEQLCDPEIKKEQDASAPEFEVISSLIDTRTALHLTRKQLSERTGIDQADISKLEKGLSNPFIRMLRRPADGMGMELKIEFVPKQNAD